MDHGSFLNLGLGPKDGRSAPMCWMSGWRVREPRLRFAPALQGPVRKRGGSNLSEDPVGGEPHDRRAPRLFNNFQGGKGTRRRAVMAGPPIHFPFSLREIAWEERERCEMRGSEVRFQTSSPFMANHASSPEKGSLVASRVSRFVGFESSSLRHLPPELGNSGSLSLP
jgi:hypothetical protein